MKTPKDEFCCQALPEILKHFQWMSVDIEGEKKLLMPHFQTYGFGDIKYRVNHCPSCGAEIRDIEINEEDLK